MNSNLSEAIEQYAQQCVDDMDIDTLMNIVKESIEDRLEDLPECEVVEELRESTYDVDLDFLEK